jgi:hypothetical protein
MGLESAGLVGCEATQTTQGMFLPFFTNFFAQTVR